MQSFKDTEGRSWNIDVNVAAAKRVRDLAGVDLLDVGQIIERLASDPILLADVLFALVKPQADQRGVSDEQFGSALGGETIDAATEAMLQALVDFFPNPRRRILATALTKMRGARQMIEAAAEKELASGNLDQVIEREISLMLGEPSTNSPASPA